MRSVVVRKANFGPLKTATVFLRWFEDPISGRKTYKYDGGMGQDAARTIKRNSILISKPNVVKDMAESAITLRALTIAGYDPSSGAGITADLQVFAAHSVAGVSAVTALTVQSRKGVRRVEPVGA